MEPHRNIAHNRNKHIEFYVPQPAPMEKGWYKKTAILVIPKVIKYNNPTQ